MLCHGAGYPQDGDIKLLYFRCISMLLYFFILLLLAVILGGSYYAYRYCFYNSMKEREKIPSTSGHQYDPYRERMKRMFLQLQDRPCEFVTIQSHDGLTLSGRYYHVKDGAPVDIAFHGYRSSPMTDFSGGSQLSFDMGHNLILVDQRAHGKSQGRSIAFGIQERHDCLRWIEYALERFGEDVQIFLYGISMGGATVLMASGMGLPTNVKGIVADCPYSSTKDIICKVAKTMNLPVKLCWPFVKLGAKIFGGFDIEETDAIAAVKTSSTPILIIHGEADGFVPCEMSDLVAHNPQKITRVTFPGADHGISYLVNEAEYRNAVYAFVEKVSR